VRFSRETLYQQIGFNWVSSGSSERTWSIPSRIALASLALGLRLLHVLEFCLPFPSTVAVAAPAAKVIVIQMVHRKWLPPTCNMQHAACNRSLLLLLLLQAVGQLLISNRDWGRQ